MISDRFGRKIDYIRLSVTDRCNLRCGYCMPTTGVDSINHKDMLTYEETVFLCGIFARLGIKKIKVTGGEPLVRKNVACLISEIKRIEGIEQVTLTTNGILIPQMAEELINAGVDGFTISLDVTDREAYHKLTGFDKLTEVLDGIEKLIKLNANNIKINCVPMAGINEEYLLDITRFAKDNKIAVRFIEVMPIGLATEYKPIPREKVIDMIESRYGKLELWNGRLGNGPAQYFSLEGFKGKIGFIDAVNHKFCGKCNRVRMTSDGFLKLCLQHNEGLDLKELLRSGQGDEHIQKIIEQTIYNKPKEHNFGQADSCCESRMFQVGG